MKVYAREREREGEEVERETTIFFSMMILAWCPIGQNLNILSYRQNLNILSYSPSIAEGLIQ